MFKQNVSRALSTRFLSGIWYMFTLIMVSSYTANLAASLTAENLYTPIQSANDLVDQHIIKYGCVKGGSTCNFFRVFYKCESCINYINIAQDAEMGTYSQMGNFMAANPEVFTESNSLGIEKVKESKGGKKILNKSKLLT